MTMLQKVLILSISF